MCEFMLSGNGRSGRCWLAVAAWCSEWPFLPPLSTCQSHPGMPASAEGRSVTVAMTVTVAMAGGVSWGTLLAWLILGFVFRLSG